MKKIQTLFAANIPCLGFLILAGWFAYLQNGYWGWPFAMACLSAKSLMSYKDKIEEERKAAIQKAQDIKKYGNIYNN